MSKAAARDAFPLAAQIASPLKWARKLLWRDLSLSTRLMAAMVVLVLITALAVGLLTYRTVSVAMVPQELERLHGRARWLAAELNSHILEARLDVLALRRAAAVEGIMGASLAGGTDPETGFGEAAWRGQLARQFFSTLAAKPAYLRARYISVTDGARDVVRVDRSGPGGAIRVAPEVEEQLKEAPPTSTPAPPRPTSALRLSWRTERPTSHRLSLIVKAAPSACRTSQCCVPSRPSTARALSSLAS